jgi:tetratricopeptide (TPR) repeat protein
VLAAIVLAALGLRVAFVLGRRGDVLFDYPVVDEERYVEIGRAIGAGLPTEPKPWLQPPGMMYALGAVFAVAGPGLLVPRLVQALLSSASCLVAFLLARRLFSRPVAFAATALCAVHGVLVFETHELLAPTWALAANLLALLLLLVCEERRSPLAALGSGLALGVSGVFAATVLPFAAVAAVWLRRAPLVAAFAAGVALPVGAVAWSNWRPNDELVLISSNAGLNFYLGNNADTHATLAVRPGPHWDDLMDEPRRAGASRPGAASSYFLRKGLAFWREHPGRAAAAYLRKLGLFFHGLEVPRDTDLYAARRDSPLLGVLVSRGPPWLPDGLLLPLALAGAIACWPERRRLALAYAFVASQALVIAAFFVTSRYRVPALPVLAMFAAAGVGACWDRWRGGGGARRFALLALVVALAVALNAPVREARISFAAELDFYRGLAYLRYLRDPTRAAERLRSASAQDPADARVFFELGNALESSRRVEEAVAAWRRAAELDPWDGRPARRVAAILSSRGDLGGAIAVLEAHVASRARPQGYYGADRLNLAFLRARRGEWEAAALELREAERLDARHFSQQIEGLTRAALAEGKSGGAGFFLLLAERNEALGRRETALAARARAHDR